MELDTAQSLVSTILLASAIVFALAHYVRYDESVHLLYVEIAALLLVFSDLGFNLSESLFWTRIWASGIYSGVLALSVAWLELVIRYARSASPSVRVPGSRGVMAVRGCAIGIWLLMISDPLHGQFVELRREADNDYRWGFWVHTGFSYSLMLGTIGILASVWRQLSGGLARRRPLILVSAPLILLTTSIAWISNPSRIPMDPTVGVVGLCALIFMADSWWARRSDPLSTNRDWPR